MTWASLTVSPARIMKHLAAMNIVGEAPGSTDGYTATPLSNSLTEQKYRDGIIYTYVFQKSYSQTLVSMAYYSVSI